MATQNFTELDFDAIKSSLRSYLQGQDKFKDYNFEGSNLSILLDILAYNTQYQAFYANMIFPERFLKHALLRKHVVAIAKNIGYTPRSARSAQATLDLTLTEEAGHTGSITIPENTKFTGTNNDGDTFNFLIPQEVVVPKLGGVYQTQVTIYEGKHFVYQKTIANGENGVIIPNAGVDTERLRVFVYESEAAVDKVEYDKSNDWTQVTSDDEVFFIEEVEDEKFKVYFGDNIVGKAIENGNVVEIEYYLASGEAANQISLFSLDDTIPDTDFVSITTVSASSGGRDIEDIESIRIAAPLFYQTQNRAVTSADYKSIILANFSNVDDAIAWGGEDNVPEDYGKVYISLKPLSGQTLSAIEKQTIVDFMIDNYAVVSIIPVAVDPNYIRATVDTEVFYDSNSANPGALQIQASATLAIRDFSNNNLEKFGKNLKYSRLVRAIDDSSNAISHSNTVVGLAMTLGDTNDIQANDFTFSNSIKPDTIISNVFVYDIYPQVVMKDDEAGNINLFEVNGGVYTEIAGPITVASIDYTTGIVTFDFLTFDVNKVTLNNGDFELSAQTDSFDIDVIRNRIIEIDDSDISVSVTDIQTNLTVT